MALNPTVEIAGVDRTNKTQVDSVSIRRSISDRSTMQCSLIERAGVYRPVPGNVIVVEQLQVAGSPGSAVRRFGGYIEDIEERAVPGNLGNITYQLQCVDFTRLLDWRLYAGSFDIGVPFGDVVQAIFDAKLASDGVTLDPGIPNGPVLSARLQDGLRPISEWFRKLATDTGYLFRIDENKVLKFGPLATSPPNPAPFSLTFGSLNWRNLTIRRRMGDYRNRQYVRTEYTVTSALTKSFIGDAVTRDFFQTDGPFSGVPVATLGSPPVTLNLGRMGFDGTGFDAYYDVEGWGIHFLAIYGNSPPANGAELLLTYRVRFQNYTQAEDAGEIAARAAIQGDSGVIEAIHEDRYIDTAAALDARALALLRQYGAIPTVVEFETDSLMESASDDLDPGMVLAMNLTDGPSDVNDSFLVESIESQWKASAPADVWRHRVQTTDQEPYGNRPTGGGGGAGAVPVILERLAEAVRIGPDVGTIQAESPEATPASPITWSATVVDSASPLTAADDIANHRPVDVEFGYRIELSEWFATLEAAGSTTSTFVIQRSTDNGTSWATVFSGSLLNGEKRVDGASFTIPNLYRDERLRYNLTAAGTGAGILTIVLDGRKVVDSSP